MIHDQHQAESTRLTELFRKWHQTGTRYAAIPHITETLTRTLVDAKDLEVNNRDEFKRDIEAILREYLRKDREITEAAKDLLEARGLPYSDLYKTKRQLAEREEFAIGEESAVGAAQTNGEASQ